MAVTLKAVLYEARADGTRSIVIRITIDRKIKYWPTGLVLPEKFWNDDASRDKMNWVRKTYPDAERFNRIIRGRLKEAEDLADLLRQIEPLTAARLKEAMEICEKRQDREPLSVDRLRVLISVGLTGTHLTAYFEDYIRTAKPSMQLTLDPIYKQLHQFFGRAVDVNGFPLKNQNGFVDPIHFHEVTKRQLTAFDLFLKDTHKNILSTRQNKLSKLKFVFDRAESDELITAKQHPLKKWEPSGVISEKRWHTLEEWKRLENLLLTLDPATSLLYDSIQLHRLQYYARGMRIGDAIRIRPEHIRGGRLYYRMQKNKKRVKSIRLHQKLYEIVKEYLVRRQQPDWKGGVYLFPFLKESIEHLPYKAQHQALSSQYSAISYNMKALAELMGVEPFSSHAARHTFTNHARKYRNEDGAKVFDVYDISKVVGHGSVATTEIYFSDFDDEDEDVVDQMYYGHTPPEISLSPQDPNDGFMKRA